MLILGFASGAIRLLDLNKIKDIDEENSTAITILDTFESGIRKTKVSDNDEFLAIGTSNGIIHLYEAKNIKKNIKYHTFQPHHDWV